MHAISLGNDPEELYCLMMGVNLRGQDISPYKAVIGEMRTIFHKVTVAVRKDDAHVDESGQVRPQLLNRNRMNWQSCCRTS